MRPACHFFGWNRRTAAVFGVLLILFVLAVFHPTAFAQQELAQQVAESAGLSQTPIGVIIARIIRVFLGILGVILTLLIIYGGWMYMSAGGDTEKVARAKQVLKNAIIGLLIILSAFAITQFILSRLLGAAGLGPGISASTARRYAEPLGSALDGRVIRDHYPPRDALDIPRNTRIFVTFVDPVAPASLIDGWSAENPAAADLNTGNVKIFETAKGEGAALASGKVKVSVTEDHRTFVFDPVDLLGNAANDTNYTVFLKPNIKKDGGGDIFTGRNKAGYQWTFEVSTLVDSTPPQIVSVLPSEGDTHDRNLTVEITFSEAMDPLSAAGAWKNGSGFSNIAVFAKEGASAEGRVNGTFEIANAYRTVSFTTEDVCAKDACDNIIYCLPASSDIKVEAKAASVDENNKPQAVLLGGGYNGLTDAAGNSLDGNGDGAGDGPPGDTATWAFKTNDNVDKRTPSIVRVAPGIREALVDPNRAVEITFNMPMKSSTLTNTNLQLWPDPYYAFWFSVASEGLDASGALAQGDTRVVSTRARVSHPSLVQQAEGGWNYYPVVTEEARGINQFCLFPSLGPARKTDEGSCSASLAAPYCCDGSASSTACEAVRSGTTLPDTSQ